MKSRIGSVAWLVVVLVAVPGCTSWKRALEAPRSQPALDEVRVPYRAGLDEYVAGLVALAKHLDENGPDDDEHSRVAHGVAKDLAARLIERARTSRAAIESSPRPIALLEDLKDDRNRAIERAIDDLGAGTVERALRLNVLNERFLNRERQHWEALAAILVEQAQPWLERRVDLFARKYFHDPEDTGGNVVEAWLNSSFDLFRSGDIGEDVRPETNGVSPWEATARLEPLVSLENANEIGVIGALGTTYHLFPDRDEGESIWSEYVQRVGVRAGAGYVESAGETGDFVVGGALQVRSLTVWGTYSFEDDDFFVALGSGDFRWLGEVTTWFE